MDYSWAMEKHDFSKIDKLNNLNNLSTFWDDVRKLTKNVSSDHSIKRWKCLADGRFNELKHLTLLEFNKSRELFKSTIGNETYNIVEQWILGKTELPDNLRNTDIMCCNYLKKMYWELKNQNVI